MAKWIDYKRLKEVLLFPTVLSHYGIAHKDAKTQDMVLCPFHEEQNPSLSINKDKGVFRCFGCGTQGNVLDFVCEMEDLDPDNGEDLAKGATIAIERILGEDPQKFGRRRNRGPKSRGRGARTAAKKSRNDTPADALEDADADDQKPSEASGKTNRVLTFELQNLAKEHPFFGRRGIGRDTVEAFGLGFCTRGIMKNRIVIPIHNRAGELVAYAGRWPEDDTPDDETKYKFPSEFRKTLELFNLHRAVERLGDRRTLFVVEGFWSAMRLHNEGFAAVAVMGQSVSEEQARIVGACADRAVLVFDGDEAGRAGMAKAALLLSEHVFTRCVLLPEGEKPDTADIAPWRDWT